MSNPGSDTSFSIDIDGKNNKVEKLNINADVLFLVRNQLKASNNLYISISSEYHEIEVDSIDLLLSVVERRKER